MVANPALAYPHKNLGMLMIHRGDYERAFTELVEATRRDPGDIETLAALGGLLAEAKATVEATRVFKRARDLAPHDARLERLIASYPGLDL